MRILWSHRPAWLKDECKRHNLITGVRIENHRQLSLHKRKQPAIHCVHEFSDSFPSLPTFVYLKFYFSFVYVTLEWEKESNSPNKTPLSLKTLQFRSTFYDFPFYVVFPLIFISDLTLWTSNKTRPRQWEHPTKGFAVRRRNEIVGKAFLWKPFGKALPRRFSTIRKTNFRDFPQRNTFAISTLNCNIASLRWKPDGSMTSFRTFSLHEAYHWKSWSFNLLLPSQAHHRPIKGYNSQNVERFYLWKGKVKAKRSFFLSLTLSYCNLSCSKLYVSVYDLKQLQTFY